jgi:hypothetical protein
MRRPLTTIWVNVRATIYDGDQNLDMHVDLVCPEVALLVHNHVGASCRV